MKSSRSILLLVALNVAWLAAASWFIAHRLREGGGGTRVEYVTNFVTVTKAAGGNVVVSTAAATNGFRWAQLESEDYRTYIARLRAIGCPEQTIRDIVIADVDKLLAPKARAASLQPRDLNYWEPVEQTLWDDAAQREAFSKQRAVDFEKREVIRDLLGVDLVGERLRMSGRDDYHGARLQFLPEDKRARARLVLDEFSDRERVLLEEQIDNPAAAPGQSAGLRQLQTEKQAALAQLLTSQEREQFDLWFSPAAAHAREAVCGMNASEEEFLKLYKLRREFEAEQGGSASPDAAQEFEGRVRQALGEGRYADYTRAQDSDFRALHALAARLNLPPQTAAELFGFKQAVEEQRAQVESDPDISPAQKQAAQQAITEETQRAFQAALGEKAFQSFARRANGRWLRGS